MARSGLFLVIVITIVAAILATAGTLLPQQGTRYGMQGMMGSAGMGDMLYPSILTVSILVLAVLVGYGVLFPTIRYSETPLPTKRRHATCYCCKL